MSDEYKIRSVDVCDDIRVERNGKFILIGVYNDSLLFSQFPAAMAQLMFRVLVDPRGNKYSKMQFRIKDKNGAELAKSEGDLFDYDPREPFAILLAVGTPTFSKPGNYTVELGLDREPEPISDFSVRGPRTPVEEDRLRPY